VPLRARGGAQDRHLVGFGGIAHANVEEEAIELRLGQRIGALLLDGILRGEHEERLGRRIVWPAAVTLCSCIASSSAACVRGGARLISSASTMFANTGPRTKRKARCPPPLSSRISVPVMSLGTRSGVNWMRRNSSRIASASDGS
jgi:hypothetical protein